MPAIPQYTVWLGVELIQVLAVYIALRTGQIRRFWDLYLYFGLVCTVSSLRFLILRHYGLDSSQYVYLYYYTDTILTLSIAIVVARLFAFAYDLKTWKGIPLRMVIPGAGVTGVAIFSYAVVEESQSKLLTRFVVEFGQNLFFALLVLTIAGWGATLAKKMRESAEVKLLWVLTIYAAMLSSNYALRNLYPALYRSWMIVPQLAGLWLAAGSALAVLSDDQQRD